jgi:ribosome-binding factor A
LIFRATGYSTDMESTRQLKVGRLVQKELSGVFVKEGQNVYGKVLVSITMVRMSTDLSVAKIYLSIFPNEKSTEVLKSLNESKAKVRHWLGQKTKGQMRIIPELIFYFDDSAAYFEKIDGMLKGLEPDKNKKEE